jgi:hypothetical protein
VEGGEDETQHEDAGNETETGETQAQPTAATGRPSRIQGERPLGHDVTVH